jgi:hypothetical protein
MHAIWLVPVLAFHSVASAESHQPPVIPSSDAKPVQTKIQLAHGWYAPVPFAPRYYPSYRFQPSPRMYVDCPTCDEPSRRYEGQRPWRPISLTLSAGLAYASGAEIAGGSGASFAARLGAGLVDRLSLTIGFEGTDCIHRGDDEVQGAAFIGLQWYPLHFLYFRGAFGAGILSYKQPGSDSRDIASDDGDNGQDVIHPALSGGIGLEISDSYGVAFALELAGTWMHLANENWSSTQINLVVSFF